MMMLVESAVLWGMVFVVSIALFYVAEKFETHNETEAHIKKPS